MAGVLGALFAPQAPAFELLDLSGSIGYTLRALRGSSDIETTSNQVRGAINARSYLWQPWFATADAALRLTEDSTDFSGGGSSTDTSIVTGDLDLNVLPQSRTPFSLSFRTSDSRVDNVSIASPLTTLGGQEFKARLLSLKQSYFNEQGDRVQARYDRNDWSSVAGDSYEDWLLGLELDVRRPGQSLVARTSYQETDRNLLDQHTENTVLNVDHFYYPSRALRLDSMVSYFGTDTTSRQPLNSTNQGDTSLDLGQFSSFAFWRPYEGPWTVSGGVRFFNLDGTTLGNDTKELSVSTLGGLYYQVSENLRLDAQVDVTVNDNDRDRTTASRERIGALYQSAIHELFTDFTWQWHAGAGFQNQDTGTQRIQGVDLTLGHDLQRMWLTDRGTFRFSVTQAVSGTQQGGDADTASERLEHSGSVSWDQASDNGSSLLQLTLADSRGFGDQRDSQQFANFQALRTQTLSLRSTLSGNLTVQTVHRDFNGQGDDDTVTATGQINYQQIGIFSVPQLRFLSDLRLSKAAPDTGVDRTEWENRLDYAIGLLNTSLSWRQIDLNGDEDYAIVYFQVDRHF